MYLHIKLRTITLLGKKNIFKTLSMQEIFEHDPKNMIKKEKGLKMLDFIKVKIFCLSKDTIKKMNRQVMVWKYTYTTYI